MGKSEVPVRKSPKAQPRAVVDLTHPVLFKSLRLMFAG
jgi:hypothetical protein